MSRFWFQRWASTCASCTLLRRCNTTVTLFKFAYCIGGADIGDIGFLSKASGVLPLHMQLVQVSRCFYLQWLLNAMHTEVWPLEQQLSVHSVTVVWGHFSKSNTNLGSLWSQCNAVYCLYCGNCDTGKVLKVCSIVCPFLYNMGFLEEILYSICLLPAICMKFIENACNLYYYVVVLARIAYEEK